MAYPYAIDLGNNGAFSRIDAVLTSGPFEYGSALYAFAYEGGDARIRAYKSIDAGVTWAAVDAAGSPAAYANDSDGYQYDAWQTGSEVAVAFLIDTPDFVDARLSFAVFDMAADSWGARVEGGPTVYEPANGLGPSGFIGWGKVAIVRRSTGEYVLAVDDHEDSDEVSFETRYFRRVSVFRYSGAWSLGAELFAPAVGVTHRDYVLGGLVLGADDAVHAFCGSLGYAGGVPNGNPTSAHLHYVPYGAGNMLGTAQTVSTAVEFENNFDLIGRPLRAGSTLYLPYRHTSGEIVVASADVAAAAFSFETAASIVEAAPAYLNAGLILTGAGALYLVWVDAVDGDRVVYRSLLSGGTWGAAVMVGSLGAAATVRVENFSVRAIAAGAGLLGFIGQPNVYFPWSYYLVTIAGGGGSRSRYYGV